MNDLFIIDAHVHTGYPNIFFSPEVSAEGLLNRMDSGKIEYSINLCSMRTLEGEQREELEKARREFDQSGKRLFYCGFYDPRRMDEDIALLREVCRWPGFAGIKIHPSFNKIPADSDRYLPVWELAASEDLPIVAHTWSVSSYNPVQVLSTPDKFEKFVSRFPSVRFVLGHSGGRGTGRFEAVRMAGTYSNVYMDFAGDIYDYRYFETMAEQVPENKILFGSDYPWLDPRAHLSRVYLSEIPLLLKRKIFRDNALEVYNLEERKC